MPVRGASLADFRQWPNAAAYAALANVAASPLQVAALSVGDLCFVTGVGVYFCTDATPGAAVWTLLPTGGAGATVGSDQIDFGTTPTTTAELVVTGQAAITPVSVVSAWLVPQETADHSADEHRVDGPKISAGNIVNGVGFTIYADACDRPGSNLYGAWSVAWSWQ